MALPLLPTTTLGLGSASSSNRVNSENCPSWRKHEPSHPFTASPKTPTRDVTRQGTAVQIFGVILAGGQASRMGGADKALADLGGQSLLAHVTRRFAPQVQSLALSANGDAARFAAYGLPVLPDDTPKGPLSGILQALLWAAPLGATAVVSVPVDGPFLPCDLVPRLCLAAEGPGLAMASSTGTPHPTFALWPITLAPALATFLASGAKARIRDFAMSHHAGFADFPDDLAFVNANTAQDLTRLAASLDSLP
jgi:molybdopterin-guanine dinucleotide biosynthesis protein A